MPVIGASLAVFALMFFFLGTGAWVFVGLLLTSFFSLWWVAGFSLTQVGLVIEPIFVGSVTSWPLAAVPLFLWMGEIINRSNVADRLFLGLTPWVKNIPGGLLHTTVGGCVLFAAISGSSVATTATIGKVTTNALEERGYDVNLALGSVAAAGSIGIMIPPSITMIIYGLLTDVSVASLFAAGLLPGLLLAALFSGFIIVRSLRDPSLAPVIEDKVVLRDLLAGAANIAPIAILIVLVLGGIYAGITTPSEAAALGVVGALVIAVLTSKFRWSDLVASAMSAVRTTAMIGTAFAAASLLSTSMGYVHAPQQIGAWIASLNLGPTELILALGIFYIILGFVLESVTLILMTMPMTFPLIVAAGIDPVWFGIFVVLVVEMGLVTPPIGFNLFVLKGVTGHPIGRIAWAALPFFGLMIVAAVIITVFPQIVLWLPSVIRG